jgi:F-type H+-transporting ATPase subunit epsilon
MPKKNEPSAAIQVIARSPFELYYEGDASALSATNRVGNFDVLPGHADFFSMLEPGEIDIHPLEGEVVTIKARNGILTVRDNEVMLFVNM